MSNRFNLLTPSNNLTKMYNKRNDFLGPLTQQFDKFFDEFFSPSSLHSMKASASFPKLNVSEENDELVIRVAVPGMTAKDIKIEFFHPTIRISGQMSETYGSPEDATYFVKELKQSYFSRELTLPEYATNDPNTSLKDGLLTLKWKKPIEKLKDSVKEIKINEE